MRFSTAENWNKPMSEHSACKCTSSTLRLEDTHGHTVLGANTILLTLVPASARPQINEPHIQWTD